MKTLEELRPIAGVVRACDALAVPREVYATLLDEGGSAD
jgi:hypothetical protein